MNRAVYAEDGCRLWTVPAGDGPPLVLCHGGPGLWDYFDAVAGMFTSVAQTIRWDQRGCGRSERRGPYTVARSVADLDALRRDLGAARIGLLGHSWGATLALRYALVHPDRVSRLVYVSGTGIDPESTWRPAFHATTDRHARAHSPRWQELAGRDRTLAEDREFAILQWTADFVDPRTARKHAERLATPWLGIGYECAGSINAEIRQYLRDTEVAALCRALTVPTLIVDGDRDIRPRSAVDSLERALPRVRRATLAGAGHLPWVEDPAGFRRVVADFLTSDDPVADPPEAERGE